MYWSVADTQTHTYTYRHKQHIIVPLLTSETYKISWIVLTQEKQQAQKMAVGEKHGGDVTNPPTSLVACARAEAGGERGKKVHKQRKKKL